MKKKIIKITEQWWINYLSYQHNLRQKPKNGMKLLSEELNLNEYNFSYYDLEKNTSLRSRNLKDLARNIFNRFNCNKNDFSFQFIPYEGDCPFERHRKEHTGSLTIPSSKNTILRLEKYLEDDFQTRDKIITLLDKECFLDILKMIKINKNEKDDIFDFIDEGSFFKLYLGLRHIDKIKSKQLINLLYPVPVTGYPKDVNRVFTESHKESRESHYHALETKILHLLEKDSKISW